MVQGPISGIASRRLIFHGWLAGQPEGEWTFDGAQAIAALAIGTDRIARVDVIAGPGNRYVQEAKRLLTGEVGIDGIAGPSELMVIAGDTSETAGAALIWPPRLVCQRGS